jgi:hypothetical protein
LTGLVFFRKRRSLRARDAPMAIACKTFGIDFSAWSAAVVGWRVCEGGVEANLAVRPVLAVQAVGDV